MSNPTPDPFLGREGEQYRSGAASLFAALARTMDGTITCPYVKPVSSVRPTNRPLAWIGADRLLLDDVTRYGLHRRVVARKGEPPNVGDYLSTAQGRTTANVYAWCVLRDDGFWYLWIVWKETMR